MELDEFKTHWKEIQLKQLMQQELTIEKLEQIIMNATNTVNHLQQKSVYWNKYNKSVSQMLLGMAVPFSLFLLIKAYLLYDKTNFGGSYLIYLSTSVAYMAIVIIFCLVTVRVLKRQVQIFSGEGSGDLKEALKKTIRDFKRFYVAYNVLYLFLYPLYYYAIINLITFNWRLSFNTMLLICIVLSVLSLAAGHVYYRVKYFSKIKLLEANLRELEEIAE